MIYFLLQPLKLRKSAHLEYLTYISLYVPSFSVLINVTLCSVTIIPPFLLVLVNKIIKSIQYPSTVHF